MTIATIDKGNAASVIDYLSQARTWLRRARLTRIERRAYKARWRAGAATIRARAH